MELLDQTEFEQLLERCEDLRAEVLRLASRRLAVSSPDTHKRYLRSVNGRGKDDDGVNADGTAGPSKDVFLATIKLIESMQEEAHTRSAPHTKVSNSWSRVKQKYGAATTIQATYRGYDTRKSLRQIVARTIHNSRNTSAHGPPVTAISPAADVALRQPPLDGEEAIDQSGCGKVHPLS